MGCSNAARGAAAAQYDCGACLFFPDEMISYRDKTRKHCWLLLVNGGSIQSGSIMEQDPKRHVLGIDFELLYIQKSIQSRSYGEISIH